MIATAEDVNGPWTLLAGNLSQDHRTVTFTTDHFSMFATIGADLKQLFSQFKAQFVDPLTHSVTAEASQPKCASENQARTDGYGISSSNGSTVYWCFGLNANSRRLTVVNNRRYPLEIYHRGASVVSKPSFFSGALQDIEPGDAVVLAPREAATFDVTLPPGAISTVSTEFDGFAQSLYSLYVGVDTLVNILTRFGFGGTKTAAAVSTLLQSSGCAHAVTGGPVEILAHCFDMADLYHAFGWKGIALSELMVFSGMINFFRSQFDSLGDQFNSRDKYTIKLTRQAAAGSPSSNIGSGGTPSGGGAPSGGGNPVVSLTQGPTAPSGYRYAISVSGFPANSGVNIVCRDSVDPGGFYSFTLTTNGSGTASTASYCYSAGGPDHWVTANGIQSNHVTWGAAPPPAATTYAETTGGVTHTWTNYTNAGGTAGQTISAYTTVHITCWLDGFRVADGNTYWYRIASSPWNNTFYASADAFYNNGATSGPLKGTPWKDPAVPHC